ncbi:MAG TPA: SRPBCC family protein [Candidatus Acidoferrales bacterium]|jgi:uncharacterized membrane protein|nr:SRPBCC family protein [Candidatus Acidoferrales bacterium]
MSDALKEKRNAEELPPSSSASTFVEGRYMPPPQDKDGKVWARTTALVQESPQRLYELWRQVENAPLWQEQIASVTQTGDRTSHWVMRSGDKTIEWDSEILADEPARRIAWRFIGGDSNNAGEVIFDATPGNRGTIVTVLQEFRIGKLTSMWETIVGRNPKQSVIENLRHFKALAETGEIPRTEGQPHGPRGTVAGIKGSMYGEKIGTPPGGKAAAKAGGQK